MDAVVKARAPSGGNKVSAPSAVFDASPTQSVGAFGASAQGAKPQKTVIGGSKTVVGGKTDSHNKVPGVDSWLFTLLSCRKAAIMVGNRVEQAAIIVGNRYEKAVICYLLRRWTLSNVSHPFVEGREARI